MVPALIMDIEDLDTGVDGSFGSVGEEENRNEVPDSSEATIV